MAGFCEHDGDLLGFVIVGDFLMSLINVNLQERHFTVELISSCSR